MAGVKRVKLLLATLFLGAVISCGGGDGGGDSGYSNASLNGLYYGGHFNLNSVGTESAFNAMTFDGKGGVAVDVDYSRIENGVGTTGHISAKDVTYSVEPDGSAILVAEADSDRSVNDGMVGAGGDTLVLSRLDDVSIHNLSFGFKAGTGHTLANLKGDYHGVALGWRGRWRNERNVFTLDGKGGYDASSWDTLSEDSDPHHDTGEYSVNDDGSGATCSDFESACHKAWFSADRSLLVHIEVDDKDEQKLYVGMKKGSGYGASTLTGTYAFGLLTRRDPTDEDPAWEMSAVGTLVFDEGTGLATLHGLGSSLKGTQQPFDGTMSYTISADGLLTLGELQGVVSADGHTLAVVPWDADTHGMLVATRQ